MQSNPSRTILVGEDELEVRGYLEMALRCLGYSVELAQDGDEVLSLLQSSRNSFAAVLLDLVMPCRDGLETLVEIRRISPDLPIIIVSGASSTANVVSAMKNGASDFLRKPVAHEDLQQAIARALEGQNDNAVASGTSSASSSAFLGRNLKMKEIYSLVGKIGWSEAPVLIQGETGSGKEVIARELHAESPRAARPFLKLNCAALPSELVESELFGYERGAFTGAFQKKAGMFELADRGTILLDEIGDMDVRLQAKLLQVLQDQEFQRIGGKETIKVDVRIMAATHRDLEKAIAERTFREDLFYRLNVINIVLPPLRERSEDIIQLAEFLMKKHCPQGSALPVITGNLKHAMTCYAWPGNVRELENFTRKFLILKDPDRLARELGEKMARSAGPPKHLYLSPEANALPPASVLEQFSKAKQQAETETILAALNSTHWNRRQAAMLLEIDYKALLYKMKKLGIDEKTPALGAAARAHAMAVGE
jgi:two-component system response regulator AtoC